MLPCRAGGKAIANFLGAHLSLVLPLLSLTVGEPAPEAPPSTRAFCPVVTTRWEERARVRYSTIHCPCVVLVS